jgi:two-component system cell cycle sensor histidine kinase/response regulator CckA
MRDEDEKRTLAERDLPRAQLERFVSLAPAAFLTFELRPDGTTRVPYASERLQEIYGLSPREVEHDGSRIFERIHPDDRPTIEAALAHSATTLSEWEYEYRSVHPTRGVLWVGGYATPERSSDGSILWYAVLHDITERRLRDQRAKENEERIASIIDSAMDAVISIDEQQRIVLFNASAEVMFGVTASEAIGQALDRFLPSSVRRVHAQHVERFGATQVTRRRMEALGALKGMRADGCEFPIEASISQALLGGRKVFTAIIRDVTERQRIEGHLRQTQKMESVGRLAGGVAHDFNNLLTVIGGCAADLAAQVKEESGQALLAELDEATQRASSLTRQLLAFSRQQVVAPRALDLSAVVRDAQSMLQRLLGEDIALRMHLGAELHPIKADPGYVTQILLNLAVNARDALPRGGHLAIQTRNVTLDERACERHGGAQPGSYVLLDVADNGTGMTEEVKARAFDPFFSTKGVGKGTGLGLSVTLGIVEQFGGHIELTSEVDVGTEIEIYFPSMREAAPPKMSNRPAQARGSETILLVEDEPGVRRVAMRILRAAGYKVLDADGAATAMALFEEHGDTIDMMITDVVMPEMDGRRLAEQLHLKRPFLRVLYMSGYTDDAVVRYGISHAEMPFLQKPFTAQDLKAKVRSVLDKASEP